MECSGSVVRSPRDVVDCKHMKSPNSIDWVAVDPAICGGKPVIRGTRIMVKNILGMVAGGCSISQIVREYPELTLEMVESALHYAAGVIDEEQVLVHG